MWGRNLTKEDLLKRGSEGDGHCIFCARDESIHHLFFSCPVVRLIWSISRVLTINTLAQPRGMVELGARLIIVLVKIELRPK
jgi:hypothetical protein